MSQACGRRRLHTVYGALLLLALSLPACISFTVKPARIDAFFAGKPHQPRHHTYIYEERPMHYVEVGAADQPLVLFVHGSPGAWDAFLGFFDDPALLSRARLASVDRPGFGASGRGRAEGSLAKQAAAIAPILHTSTSPPGAILVGHSYGAPVIAQLAIDFPQRVRGLVMVAPSIDPTLERTKWFQVVAEWKLLTWMVPGVLVASNREILALKAELEALLPRWQEIEVPVTVIQGEADRLVPPANADFAQRVLVNAPLTVERIPDLNHFVPWRRPELITAAILDHLAE